MTRVIYEGVPDFVPIVMTLEQAEATFAAVRAAFMATHEALYAQAMVKLAEAIDEKRAKLAAETT